MAQRWKDIEALGLTKPERKLVEACKRGEPCVLGDGTRPEAPDPEREIRAEVLRYLILGGGRGLRGARAGRAACGGVGERDA